MMLVCAPLWGVGVEFPAQNIGASGHIGSVLLPASKLQFLCLLDQPYLIRWKSIRCDPGWRKKWLEITDWPLEYFLSTSS